MASDEQIQALLERIEELESQVEALHRELVAMRRVEAIGSPMKRVRMAEVAKYVPGLVDPATL